MSSTLQRSKMWLQHVKASFAAIVLVVSIASIARAADSTGNVNTAWGDGGLFDANVFSPDAAYGSKTVALANDKTLHLVRLGAGFNELGFGLFQLTSTGTFDTSFSTDGWLKQGLTVGSTTVSGMLPVSLNVLGNGDIMVVGTYYDHVSATQTIGLFVAKYDSTGAPKVAFGTNGVVLTNYNTIDTSTNWLYNTPAIHYAPSSGKIYAYYGINGENIIRLNPNGTADLTFGSTGLYRGLYSATPLYNNGSGVNADVKVKGFTVDESATPPTATFYGVDSSTNPVKSSAVMYRLKFGTTASGTHRLAELDTSQSWTSVINGATSTTAGYSRVDLGGFGYTAGSVAFSSANFAYLIAQISSSTMKVVAFDPSQRTPYIAFGTNGVKDITAQGFGTIASLDVVGTGPDKIMVTGTDSNYKVRLAKYSQTDGSLIPEFGTSGVATLTTCTGFHTISAIAVTTNGDIAISGATTAGSTASPRIARLGSGAATTQCGTTTTAAPTTNPPTNGGGGGIGGGGGGIGGGAPLATPLATAVEVPGEGIRITVTNLAPNAKISAMVNETSITYGPQSAESPWVTEGETNSQTLLVTEVVLTPTTALTPYASRRKPLVAGETYRVRVFQIIGSFSLPSSMSSPISINVTLTSAVTTSTVPVATTPTTTGAPVGSATTVPKVTTNVYANAIPGVTVTDPKVYVTAPTKVSSASAIDVLTPTQAKTSDIVSKTPSVCLPNDEDLVFIDEGRCIAQVVNEKTRKVLRTLRTTVVDDEVSELKVGNEIAVLSPLYFTAGTAMLREVSVKRLNSLVPKVKTAGSILVAGHSGNLMGDTAENRALSRERANTVVSALKKRGATADFAIAAVGALDPVSTGDSRTDQDKNRRAVIVLIP